MKESEIEAIANRIADIIGERFFGYGIPEIESCREGVAINMDEIYKEIESNNTNIAEVEGSRSE